MPLWSNTDSNTGSPIFAPAQVQLAPTRANANAIFSNTTANLYISGLTVGVFGVSANEAQAANNGNVVTHAGWQLRTVGVGGRAGRVHNETLVAMSSIGGDQEDTIFVDYRIVVDSQPSDSNEQTTNAVSFTIVASSVPSGATLRYQWQSDGGPGAQTWANVANTGVFSNSNTATLNIANNITLNGNIYRVSVTADGANEVFSANVLLSSY